MKTISEIVIEEEVKRRNTLLKQCVGNIEAAIKADTVTNAMIFVSVLFGISLSRAARAVGVIRNGKDVYDTLCNIHDTLELKPVDDEIADSDAIIDDTDDNDVLINNEIADNDNYCKGCKWNVRNNCYYTGARDIDCFEKDANV